jgi:hypothetical protein
MSGQPLDFIKYAADTALTVPSLIGLRNYVMTLTFTTWTGRPGQGAPTITTKTLVNGTSLDGYANPRFRQVSKQEIVLSGNLLKDQDVVIGPFVFPYDTGLGEAGGTNPDIFSDPIATVGSVTEMYINIAGANLPTGGSNFKKIWDETSKNVIYKVYLRDTGTI